MTRRKQPTEAQPDPFADEAKSANVQWFWPADFDTADDSLQAKDCTGWFYRTRFQRESFDRWMGPYLTSQAAAEAKAVDPNYCEECGRTPCVF